MESDDDLANRLLTLAGMIMEDAAPVAVIVSGDTAEWIAAVRKAGQDVVTLVDAAQVVRRRG